MSYGKSDQYTWIPEGARNLDRLLADKDVEQSLRTFDGGHPIYAFSQADFVHFVSGRFADRMRSAAAYAAGPHFTPVAWIGQ
jgi:hypothetical protein